ncbi:ATP phosphoribosyltransferase [Paenibacillaceae bacterium]|nr:ATP phosphoribosyltransferase [Paenibacillaceae bacterium]
MHGRIRIAMPKGNRQVTERFREAGYPLPDDFDESRQYIVPIPETNVEFIVAKPADIPTYVAYGVADLGVVGKEVLLEEMKEVYELLDLEISKSKLSVIGQADKKMTNPRVATAYPNIAAAYFREKGEQVDVVKLNGGLELSLVTGLADCIVDVVENDPSCYFEQYGFVEWAVIRQVSSRFIANRASCNLKNEDIERIYSKLRAQIS